MKKTNLIFRFVVEQIRGHKKNRGNSIRFKNYYLESKDDNRTNFAKILDYLIWRIATFFVLFFFLYLRTKKLYLSVISASAIIIILHSVAIKGRNRKLQQMKKQKRRYVAGKRVYNEIMNKTVDEMEKYIKDLFNLMGFNQFNFIEGGQRYILLEASYKGDKIMILLYMYRNNFDVELKEVKEFIYTITDNKMKKGILITTSNFTNDSYDFIDKISKKYTLLLINREQFLNIIEENGMFPNEEEIDEIIESKISKEKSRWNKYKNIILSKNKIKGYIVVGIYLILSAWYTPYTVYYLIVATLILATAFITFIFNTIYNFDADKEKSIDFEQLLNNM